MRCRTSNAQPAAWSLSPCRPRRRPRHPFLLYRRRPARRGAVHARTDAAVARLDLRGARARGKVSKPSFLYRLSVHVVTRAAPLVARFDKKVARGLDGRRGLAARVAGWAAAQRDPKRPLIWMHAPSVGEGLQAKPVLETLRAEHPDWQLAFTFFSPSAERLAKNLPVDIADYLPLDRPSEVSAVLDALQPNALVFSKLDVWPELTLAAARRGVKLGLISATVAPESSRLRWPTRQWSAPAYRALDRVGAISEDDAERLRHLKLPRPVRLSQLEHAKPGPVIVVDRVGILADLYALGDAAFVGGGFHRAGLHSVLEPAVFGVPTVFGPHWRMSRDATLLLEQGGAVALPADARHPLHSQWLVWHHDPAARRSAGKAAKIMVEEGRGASERTTALVRGLVM